MVKRNHLYLYPRLLLFFCFVVFNNGHLFAKLIEPESLLLQIVKSYKEIGQMYLEVEVKVFDPEAFFPLEEKYQEGTIPYEVIEKSFSQNIIWVRDEDLLIETMDLKGNLLNIYIFESESNRFFQNLQTDRIFSADDVIFPHFLIYTKHISVLKRGLFGLGISTANVKIKQQKFHNAYQLGTDTENILVDSKNFRVLELNRQIQIWGRYYPSKITFSEWDKKRGRIPHLTQFYIDSRLFKEIRIKKYQARGFYKKRRHFINQYKKRIPDSKSYSLDCEYSQ